MILVTGCCGASAGALPTCMALSLASLTQARTIIAVASDNASAAVRSSIRREDRVCIMRAFGSGVSVRCAKDGTGKNPAQVHCKSLTDLTANTRDFYAV